MIHPWRNTLSLVVRHADLPFSDDGGCHVDDDRLGVGPRRREGDWICAELAVDTPKRRDLPSQSAGVHESERHESLAGGHERIGTGSADVSGISQCRGGDAVLAGQLHGELNRQATAYLPEPATAVDDGRAAPLTGDGGLTARVKTALEDFLDILVVAQCAVAVLAKQVRLHEVIDDGRCVRRRTASGLEELAANLTEVHVSEARHR